MPKIRKPRKKAYSMEIAPGDMPRDWLPLTIPALRDELEFAMDQLEASNKHFTVREATVTKHGEELPPGYVEVWTSSLNKRRKRRKEVSPG